ncbi:phosphoribosylanthranilate isomerase [Aquiflexum gelatinilyticum]|uniref:N-(5'-phosphoribosyl)anthranilate isomerase n=1 Tax=Aquiflexum gelatinilyticum TaxID=2961943 RepID=A0A9X2P3M7_9BACT|nr:phosphoribosylanthranilate isomerase [Aquiflexum gelatinilyticum]MCR9014041.1 phosphoribosylanthranilate isomerase [Aquiflexum gelatinilyticum]
MKLKVCGMRESANVRNLLDQVQPDWMGLIFYPASPRFVDDIQADWIRDTKIRKVGVFVDASLTDIAEKIQKFGLSTIQLHGNESVEEVREIKEKTGLEVFKVFSIDKNIDWKHLEGYLPHVDYFLFDTFTHTYGGSGKTFNWQILLDYPFDKPFLLSGGLTLGHLDAIGDMKSKVPQLQGLDINSKFEIEPGLKDIDLVSEFKKSLKF